MIRLNRSPISSLTSSFQNKNAARISIFKGRTKTINPAITPNAIIQRLDLIFKKFVFSNTPRNNVKRKNE
jgi:hypothetical protein